MWYSTIFEKSKNNLQNPVTESGTMPSKRKRVGKYELGKTIGEGSFGKVKIGVDTDTGRKYAIKIIERDSMMNDSTFVEQVNREIAVMKMLKHPGVVQLREVMSNNTKLFLVEELCSGGELFELVIGDQRDQYNRSEVRRSQNAAFPYRHNYPLPFFMALGHALLFHMHYISLLLVLFLISSPLTPMLLLPCTSRLLPGSIFSKSCVQWNICMARALCIAISSWRICSLTRMATSN
jgi:hypothetical protein